MKIYMIFDRTHGNYQEDVYEDKEAAQLELKKAQDLNAKLYNNRFNWYIVELNLIKAAI